VRRKLFKHSKAGKLPLSLGLAYPKKQNVWSLGKLIPEVEASHGSMFVIYCFSLIERCAERGIPCLLSDMTLSDPYSLSLSLSLAQSGFNFAFINVAFRCR
jgi:hypothetical protein